MPLLETSFVTNIALKEILEGSINLSLDTIKAALVTDDYDGDPDDEVADDGTANDVASNEPEVSGYTGGYGGAGRQALANKSFSADDSRNSGKFTNTVDITWTSLGAGATIQGVVLLIEDFVGVAGNDTETRVISFHRASTPVDTNGSDIKAVIATNGLIELKNS